MPLPSNNYVKAQQPGSMQKVVYFEKAATTNLKSMTDSIT
jgi:hypothetical protein